MMNYYNNMMENYYNMMGGSYGALSFTLDWLTSLAVLVLVILGIIALWKYIKK